MGNLYITSQRVILRGGQQTRECQFAKMISYEHTPGGTMTISVGNRQKATTMEYAPGISGWVGFRFDLAPARYSDQLPAFVAQGQEDPCAADSARPIAPEGIDAASI